MLTAQPNVCEPCCHTVSTTDAGCLRVFLPSSLGLQINNSHQGHPLPQESVTSQFTTTSPHALKRGMGQGRRGRKGDRGSHITHLAHWRIREDRPRMCRANVFIRERWKRTAKRERGSKGGKPLLHPGKGLSFISGWKVGAHWGHLWYGWSILGSFQMELACSLHILHMLPRPKRRATHPFRGKVMCSTWLVYGPPGLLPSLPKGLHSSHHNIRRSLK